MPHLDDQVKAICRWLCGFIPWGDLDKYDFLPLAIVGMMLIAPLCATIGIQVVNLRLAFFAEAIGHSAYTGIGLGLLLVALVPASLGLSPLLVMVMFGVIVGMGVTIFRRNSSLSSDTVIGVFSSSIIALGLCLIPPGFKINEYLIGNILIIQPTEIVMLTGLAVLVLLFQAWSYNRLLFLGVNPQLAQTMGVKVGWYDYTFACLLSLIVMFSIRAVGILMVSSLLTIPAAAARNLARSASGMFWWAVIIALTSALAGMVISITKDFGTGSTTVLCCTAWFIISSIVRWFRKT